MRLTETFGGASFNGSLYHVASRSECAGWTQLATGAFPELSQRCTCFAHDWLGRFFAIDTSRIDEGPPGVLLIEPGTGEVLEIPGGIDNFHDVELVARQDAALASDFYAKWRASGGAAPARDQCVGYKKPLFLGGRDAISNLELSDFDVYWTLMAQLILQTKCLPPGTKIGKVTIDR